MKKSKLIGLMSGIGCLALAFGSVAQVTTSANAEKTIGGVDVSSFSMEYGASVRFKANDPAYKNGIRFSRRPRTVSANRFRRSSEACVRSRLSAPRIL